MKKNYTANSVARLSAVQALYKIDASNVSLEEALSEFSSYHFPNQSHQNLQQPDYALFSTIVRGVMEREEDISALIQKHLPPEWPYERLELILKLILKAACYEIISSLDLDAKIILNEYVNLTAAYYDKRETIFINGILNQIARALRPECFQS